MFLKNRNTSSKIKRSNVTDYAALSMFHGTNLILNSDVDQDSSIFGSHEGSLVHIKI